jgi:nitronate monooxygenase
MAAALCLGAAGVVMGTRFLATPEAPASALHKRLIVAAGPDATVASGIPDLLWGANWPGVQARTLRNRLMLRWAGREDELRAAREAALADLQRAEAAGDPEEMIFLAGMGASRIDDLRPAGEIVGEVVAEAARLLREWGERLGG